MYITQETPLCVMYTEFMSCKLVLTANWILTCFIYGLQSNNHEIHSLLVSACWRGRVKRHLNISINLWNLEIGAYVLRFVHILVNGKLTKNATMHTFYRQSYKKKWPVPLTSAFLILNCYNAFYVVLITMKSCVYSACCLLAYYICLYFICICNCILTAWGFQRKGWNSMC